METIAAVILSAAGLAVLGDRLTVWRTERRLSAPRPAVLVVTRDDQTFRGTLWTRRPVLELRGAELITPNGPQPIEGSVILEPAVVAWVQLTSPPEV